MRHVWLLCVQDGERVGKGEGGRGKGGRGRSSELIPHLVHFLVLFVTIFTLFYFLNEPFPVVQLY